MECRERDLEQYYRLQTEIEMFDPALVSLRGAIIHGHSLRLSENGLQFDALRRCVLSNDGIIRYLKNQIDLPLKRLVDVGKPLDSARLKTHSTIFYSLVGAG
ncbi:MAG: coenzyme-B sulfoethylthiotransferase subunit gamma, partial [Methanomicrobiales archaeon]